MKQKIKLGSCLLFGAAICFGAAIYADETKSHNRKPWNQPNAVWAFSVALTRSAHDQAFRDRLKASPESAKQAVAEVGQIDVPNDVVMMFHEGSSNENYHIFDLPKFDENAQAKHGYQEHLECCYHPW